MVQKVSQKPLLLRRTAGLTEVPVDKSMWMACLTRSPRKMSVGKKVHEAVVQKRFGRFPLSPDIKTVGRFSQSAWAFLFTAIKSPFEVVD